MFPNSLSSHASLLLSQNTPTIISSPLQTTSNNCSSPRQTPQSPLPTPSTNPKGFLPSVIDRLHQRRAALDAGQPVINFKKPQNEMFKKLDGKIQKIVAAHSLNKIYALNDFTSFGKGPTELPPQLPPPPPWVPKTVGQMDPQTLFNTIRRETSILLKRQPSLPTKSSISLLTDQLKTISKNQRLVPPNVAHQRINNNSNINNNNINRRETSILLKRQQGPPPPVRSTSSSLLVDDRSQIISKNKFAPKVAHQHNNNNSNNNRRETSILLKRPQQQQQQPPPQARSSAEPFQAQVHNLLAERLKNKFISSVQSQNRRPINRQQSVQVIVPPTHEHHFGLRLGNYYDREPPQPNNDVITKDQFIRCLNLVRSDDAILQIHQERQSEMDIKWEKYFKVNPARPGLRIRRLRGEKMRMPASASYRAARKAGLQ